MSEIQASANQISPEVFRVKRSEFYFYAIGGLMLGVLGSLLFFMLDKNGDHALQELSTMIVALGVVGICLAIARLRRRLQITGDEVISRGLFTTKRYRFNEIVALTWGLHFPEIHIRIGRKFELFRLASYAQKDFDRLVYLFRTGIPEDRQSNWLVFSYLYSKKAKDPIAPELQQILDEGELDFQKTNEKSLLDSHQSTKDVKQRVVLQKHPLVRYAGTYFCAVFAVFVAFVGFVPIKDGTAVFLDGSYMSTAAFGTLLLLCTSSFWFYRVSLKQRLVITDDEVVQHGFWRIKRFRFSEVRSLRWGKNNMGLSVYFTKGSFTIEASDYLGKDFDRIVYFFRTGVPVDRQTNWDWMCKHYAMSPVPRNIILDPPDPAKGEKLRTRRFYDGIMAVAVLSFWGMGAFVWFFVGDSMPANPMLGCVAVSLFLLCVLFPIRFIYPPEGTIVEVGPKHKTWSCLWWGALLFLLGSFMSLVIWPFPGAARFILLGSWIPLAIVFALYIWKASLEIEKRNHRQRHELLEKLTVEEFLNPPRVFGHLDEHGKNEVELKD